MRDVDPGLRTSARLMRLISRPNRSEADLRRGSWFLGLARRLPGPRGLRSEERWIPRPDGSRLRVRVYRGVRPAAPGPGILWLHGGGYVLGSPEQDGTTYRRIVEATGATIVAPAYRLGPEAPYPAALDDACTTLLWLRDHADELGVRTDQLAVAGNSAGGGLTAALTLLARDRGEVAIAFQLPLYPMIDDRCSTASAGENDAPVWDAVTNRSAWRVYLGPLAGSPDVPPYAAPARATDVAGLPPAFTYVGDLEPFRDEVVAYVERLRAAGVEVAFELVPGCYHGFDVVAPRAPRSAVVRSPPSRPGCAWPPRRSWLRSPTPCAIACPCRWTAAAQLASVRRWSARPREGSEAEALAGAGRAGPAAFRQPRRRARGHPRPRAHGSLGRCRAASAR